MAQPKIEPCILCYDPMVAAGMKLDNVCHAHGTWYVKKPCLLHGIEIELKQWNRIMRSARKRIVKEAKDGQKRPEAG